MVSIDMNKTGLRIKECVYDAGYSVKFIQEYLGLSCPQPIYRWYKGKILPSIDNLLRLSELLNIHMEDLLVKSKETIHIFEVMSSNHRPSILKRLLSYYTEVSGWSDFGLSVQ
ncbi:MAG: helix-turn-helix domain-containing protein [Lachnospiraceae bacterium]|nr:helix-turn-helix domain-containing protein [Lachnospiraceae bacterium]